MLKPNVGDILSMSSPLNFLIMVVLPALSSPSTSNLIYFYFYFVRFTIDMKPILFWILENAYYLYLNLYMFEHV